MNKEIIVFSFCILSILLIGSLGSLQVEDKTTMKNFNELVNQKYATYKNNSSMISKAEIFYKENCALIDTKLAGSVLDKATLLGVIAVESTFDKYAISKTAAFGLFQIKPFHYCNQAFTTVKEFLSQDTICFSFNESRDSDLIVKKDDASDTFSTNTKMNSLNGSAVAPKIYYSTEVQIGIFKDHTENQIKSIKTKSNTSNCDNKNYLALAISAWNSYNKENACNKILNARDEKGKITENTGNWIADIYTWKKVFEEQSWINQTSKCTLKQTEQLPKVTVNASSMPVVIKVDTTNLVESEPVKNIVQQPVKQVTINKETTKTSQTVESKCTSIKGCLELIGKRLIANIFEGKYS